MLTSHQIALRRPNRGKACELKSGVQRRDPVAIVSRVLTLDTGVKMTGVWTVLPEAQTRYTYCTLASYTQLTQATLVYIADFKMVDVYLIFLVEPLFVADTVTYKLIDAEL